MNTNWNKEFKEFLDSEDVSPPAAFAEDLHNKIKTDLNPSIPIVFGKLAMATALAGSLSMLVCPQFGYGGNLSSKLMQLAMQYGSWACQLACGAFFCSTGVLTATLLLRPEELKVLGKTKVLQLAAISALSLALFICSGPATFQALEILWFIGAFFGSLLTFEAGVFIRRQLSAVSKL